MRNDRFLKEAEGDEQKASALRTVFYKGVAPKGAHADCPHDTTRAARQVCRRRAQREANTDASQG